MPPSASALSPPRATRSRTRTRDRGDSSPPPASERRPARSGGPDSDVRELLEGATYDVEPVPAPPAPPTAAELALVAEFSPVVRQIAGSFQRRLPRNVLRDDLIAAGMTGLWDAIQKHGTDGTGTFAWYVRVRIRGAILDELRAQDWLPRRARAAAAAQGLTSAPIVLRFDEVSDAEQARCLTATHVAHGDAVLEARFVRESLARCVDLLPERERQIVALHYWKGVKFSELGRMLGVSEPRISQLHARAMGRLRELMREAEAA